MNSEGLACEDRLPLAWKVESALPDEAEILRINGSNEALLQVLAGLEEHVPRVEDHPGEMTQALYRLDAKMELLIGLLGDALRRQSSLPSAVPVRFSGMDLIWPAGDRPPAGTLLSIDLYVSSTVPRALHLFGRAGPADVDGHIHVAFVEMGAAVREGLEKLVFRRHRRAIAQSRQPRDA